MVDHYCFAAHTDKPYQNGQFSVNMVVYQMKAIGFQLRNKECSEIKPPQVLTSTGIRICSVLNCNKIFVPVQFSLVQQKLSRRVRVSNGLFVADQGH